tara:strand:- start:243 stop:1301 length:1059 start_codon:yes stop_codon:yes gene_type:complete
MADTQTAPQVPAGLQPIPALDGSIDEAQEALLSLMEPEEEKPESEESQPTEEEESQPQEEDESLEEESEEEEEAEEAEEESEEESEEDEDGEELYAVTVNGEEQEVSLDELVKGYSRQSDYTRKTQELASERNQMEQVQSQWAQEISETQEARQQYMNTISQLVQNQLSGLEKFGNVDWETLKEEDPIQFVTKREEFRQAQERIQQMQQQQQRAQQEEDLEIKRVKSLAIQEEHKRLVSAVPEWNDKDKRVKMVNELSSYAISQGFTKEELNDLIDHRSLIVLMKAAKFDAIKKPEIKAKKLKNKPKVIRAGKGASKKEDSTRAKRTAQMKRLQGSGRVEHATTLLEDFIDI